MYTRVYSCVHVGIQLCTHVYTHASSVKDIRLAYLCWDIDTSIIGEYKDCKPSKCSYSDTDLVQPVRLPLVVSYITLAFMAFIVVLFGFFDDTRLALVVGAIWCVFLLAYYRLAVAPRLAKNAKLAIASDVQDG